MSTSGHSETVREEPVVRMTGFPIPNIPAPDKFVRENITMFLREYTMYMAAFGRDNEEQLASMVIYFLDQKVRDRVRNRVRFCCLKLDIYLFSSLGPDLKLDFSSPTKTRNSIFRVQLRLET